LAAAIKEIQQQNAAVTEEALARAAILLQAQYDASHHQVHNPNADPLKPAASQVIKEAESQVGLTHQFDNKTLDAAASSLSGSALATAPADEYSQATVSVGDARTAIQNGLDQGLSMQEAVNAARVQFGGLQPNDTVLDEAALTIQGDTLVSNGHAAGGNVLTDASKQLAGLHLFNGDTDEVPPGAPGHPGQAARVGSKLGAERLGMSVYEIPPGEAIGPYHFEWTDEEWLIVLDGQPTVRTPEGERVLEPGEVTCFLAGPEGVHQVRNATDAPARVAIVATNNEFGIVEYPEIEKVGIWAGPEHYELDRPKDNA